MDQMEKITGFGGDASQRLPVRISIDSESTVAGLQIGIP